MKKCIFLGLVITAAGAAFAAPGFGMSAGVGGYFTSDFGARLDASSRGPTYENRIVYYGGGGLVFLDAAYAEFSLGFWGGGGAIKYSIPGYFYGEMDLTSMGVDIGLMGKYPFAIGEKLTVFPLLGFNYRVMLSMTDEDGNQIPDLNTGEKAPGNFSVLWFRAGGGVDFPLTGNIYLRYELLYGLWLTNKFEKDLTDILEADGWTVNTSPGHGLEMKAAVGFRF